MKSFVFCLTLMILSVNVFAIDRSDIDGSYFRDALPTWVDSAGNVSPRIVLQQDFTTELFPSGGFSQNVFWHKLTFPAATVDGDKTYYLKVSNFLIDELNFYLFHGDQMVAQWARGDRQQWDEDMPYEGIWIPIALAPNDETTLLVRRFSDGPILFPIAFYDDSSVAQAKKQQHTLWIVSLTALILLLGYNVLIYLMTRERSFFYYVLFNAGLIVSLGLILGFSRYLIPNNFIHEWLSTYIITLHTALLWAVCRFSLSFLNIEKLYPVFWKHRFKMDAMFAGLVVLSCFLMESAMAAVFLVAQIAVSALCTYWAFYTKSSHTLATRFYLFSWSILIVGALTGSLIYWDLMPYNGFTEYAFLGASLCQLFGFSLAYSAQIRKINKDRYYTNLTDLLTGLPNRQFLLTQMNELLRESDNGEKGGKGPCLVLISLTGHAALTRAVGPAKADLAVRQMFLNLNRELLPMACVVSIPWLERSTVKLMRTSADSCVFISKPHQLEMIFSKLIPTLETSLLIEELEFSFPFNIGVATFSDSINSVERLYQNAQLAAEANQYSREDWSVFNQQMKSDHKHHLNVLSLLNRDLKRGLLRFAVQPQVELSSQRIIGAEVLLRWHCEELGDVSPALFIPLAEKTGLILKITEYLIQAVFLWVRDNPEVLANRSLSINISAKDLQQSDFCQKIIEMKQRFNVPAERILLEVTETAVYDDNNVFQANLSLLKKHHFNFSIDDFGTGYSSMRSVVSLAPDEIKLDRMFVSAIDTSPINQILSDCIIDLSIKIEAQSVAEGIETNEEMMAVKRLSCQIGQGFFFYKPMTPDEYLALIR